MLCALFNKILSPMQGEGAVPSCLLVWNSGENPYSIMATNPALSVTMRAAFEHNMKGISRRRTIAFALPACIVGCLIHVCANFLGGLPAAVDRALTTPTGALFFTLGGLCTTLSLGVTGVLLFRTGFTPIRVSPFRAAVSKYGRWL